MLAAIPSRKPLFDQPSVYYISRAVNHDNLYIIKKLPDWKIKTKSLWKK